MEDAAFGNVCVVADHAYTVFVHRLLTPLCRRLYAFTGAFLAVYFLIVAVQNSGWNKERLYQNVMSGDEGQRLSAVTDLVYLRGQTQLVRALKSRSPAVREVVLNSLWNLWFHEAGEEAFELTQAARKAVERRAYQDALAILTDLTRRFPDFAEGWNRRGTLYSELGDYEQAVADARKVVALNPDHFGAWQGMGLCQLRLGDVAAAREAFRAALRILPYDRVVKKYLRLCDEMLRRTPPDPSLHRDLI